MAEKDRQTPRLNAAARATSFTETGRFPAFGSLKTHGCNVGGQRRLVGGIDQRPGEIARSPNNEGTRPGAVEAGRVPPWVRELFPEGCPRAFGTSMEPPESLGPYPKRMKEPG